MKKGRIKSQKGGGLEESKRKTCKRERKKAKESSKREKDRKNVVS